MNFEFIASGTKGFTRSTVQSRNLALPNFMEVMMAGAVVPRQGWRKFVSSSGKLTTSTTLDFFSTIYCTMHITCSWNTGEVKTLTITTDKVYGDYSGTAQTTLTNVYGNVGNLSSNVSIGGLVITPPTGKKNPQDTPTTLTIASDGLSASATYVVGGVTVLTLSAVLSNPYTFSQALTDCLDKLQLVTLCDDIAAPAKTYSAAQQNSAAYPVSNFCLRYPSQYGSPGLPAPAVNGIYYAPKRASADYQAINFGDQTSFAWESDLFQFTVAGTNSKFFRGLFAYGINVAFAATPLLTSANSLLCMKTAIRANQKMTTGKICNLTIPTAAHTTTDWTQLLLSNKSKGFYIMDPNSFRGLSVDPTVGKATIIVPSELHPETSPGAGDAAYGGIQWNYV